MARKEFNAYAATRPSSNRMRLASKRSGFDRGHDGGPSARSRRYRPSLASRRVRAGEVLAETIVMTRFSTPLATQGAKVCGTSGWNKRLAHSANPGTRRIRNGKPPGLSISRCGPLRYHADSDTTIRCHWAVPMRSSMAPFHRVAEALGPPAEERAPALPLTRPGDASEGA